MKTFIQYLNENTEDNTANPYAHSGTKDVLERLARNHIYQAKNAKKHGVDSMDAAGNFISSVIDHFTKNTDLNDYRIRVHSENAANALEAHEIEVPEDLMDQVKEAHEFQA